MSDEHGSQVHPDLKCSGGWFNRTQLPNTSCRMSKMTFAVCGHAPSCWQTVASACRAPWMTEWLFYSYCRYHWFVMIPCTKISPVKPLLAGVHHMMHPAGWSDISTTVWIFRGSETCVLLFLNPLVWKWTSSLNYRQSKMHCLPGCKFLTFLHPWYHLLLFPLVIP